MPETFPLNNRIPAGFKLPGIYLSFLVGDTGSSAPNNRCLLWGYAAPGAPAALNTPFLAVTQEQVDAQGGGSDTMISHAYAAAKAQLPAGVGAEVWCLPLAEPAGTKATHLIKFLAAPVAGVLGTNTAASASATCTITIDDLAVSFQFAQGDAFSDIATKAKTALDSLESLPVNVTISGGDTLVLTDVHPGVHGNEMPVSVSFSNLECAVSASPGTVTIAGGPATAAGSVTVKGPFRNAVATIANADTDAAIATKVRDKLNSDAYSMAAAVASPATGVVTLYYRPGRVLHRLGVSATGGGAITAALAAGTLGTGNPTITSALSALTGLSETYKAWSVFFSDTSNWSSLAAQVIAQADSPIEKGQHVFYAETTSVVDLATTDLAMATSPKLTSSPRFKLVHEQGATVRGFKLAARAAAMFAAETFQSRNFNGRQLVGSETSPLGVPHRADRPTLDELNTATATFRRAVVAVDDAGLNAIVRSTTTYAAKGSIDAKQEKWSCQMALDYMRDDLKVFLRGLFPEKSVKRFSLPRTANTTTPDGVKQAVYRKLLDFDARDLYDGAKENRDAILAGILVSPTRVDIAIPLRPPADLDQIVGVGIQQ